MKKMKRTECPECHEPSIVRDSIVHMTQHIEVSDDGEVKLKEVVSVEPITLLYKQVSYRCCNCDFMSLDISDFL